MISLVVIGIWGLLALFGLKKHNVISIKILMFMIVMQNFILIIVSKYMNQTTYNFFILEKEIYVCLLIVIGYIKRPKIKKIELGCFSCILIIILYATFNSTDSLFGTLASVRQLYLPFLFVLLGTTVFKTVKDIEECIRFFLKMMLLCALFGWVEMILGDVFWINLGYSEYAKLKSIESGLTMDTGISGAFYSYDLGIRIRRMGSFLAEPVILGQLMAMALVISIFQKGVYKNKFHKIISVIIYTVALACTLAKGGIIIALFSFAFILGKVWKERGLSIILKITFWVVLIMGIAYAFSSETNGVTHINGLIDNIKYLPFYPLGRGIGAVGNLGYNYGGREVLLANGESFIGAAIGQMGVVAIVIYGWLYMYLFKTLRRCSKFELFGVGNIVLWLNIGLFLTSLINNTAISFTSCFIYYILASAVFIVFTRESYSRNINSM